MKVTVISLDNWGYNKYIAKELQKNGVEVRHLDFNKVKYKYPSIFHKILNFFTKTFFNFNFKRHHLNKVLLKLIEKKEKQDHILIIKGDDLSIATIKKLKLKTKNLIAFFNDSFDRYPRMKKVYPYFDSVYSFDPKDANEYQFKFIPNYIYFDLNLRKKCSKKYNIFNISSLDKRSKTLPLLASYFKEKNIEYKLIAFSKKEPDSFNNLGIEITNKTYPLKKILHNFVLNSNILLDLQRPKQLGLSFRVFEAIALEKKIITTNTSISSYDFYNPNNIAIIDINNIQISEHFFKEPYQPIDAIIVNKYHISSWVKEVFNTDNNKI